MTKTGLSMEARRHEPLTRTDEFRKLLDRLEAKIGLLGRGLAGEAVHIPAWLDEATETLESLKSKGGEFSAEEARLRTIYAQFDRKGAQFLREIGGARALHQARQAVAPDRERWWWYMDEKVAAQRQTQLRNLLRTGALVLVVLAILYGVYQAFFAPDPATVARLEHQHAAEDLALNGDYAGALREIEQALALAPDDAESLIIKGVVADNLGDTALAEESFAAARTALADDEEKFLSTRTQTYIVMGQPEQALADAEALLALNPQSAVAYYFRAIVHDSLGNVLQAIADLEQVSALAQASGDVQLEAMARMYLSNLFQRAAVPTFEVPEPTESGG